MSSGEGMPRADGSVSEKDEERSVVAAFRLAMVCQLYEDFKICPYKRFFAVLPEKTNSNECARAAGSPALDS